MYTTHETGKDWITPWGKSHGALRIEHESGRRIYRLDTPSHGGYAVPRASVDSRVPYRLRPSTMNAFFYFFEEDCEWAIAAKYFPEFFPDTDEIRESIKWTMDNFYRNTQ